MNELNFNDEALERIFNRFEGKLKTVEKICEGVAKGTMNGLVVSGPPGVGKTYSVESFLAKHKRRGGKHITVKGRGLTPLSVYTLLYNYQNRGDVVVLDDADINDLDTLNLLKAAGDTSSSSRLVSYHTSSVDKLGLPRDFKFSGGIVVLTNKAFEDEKRMRVHFEALNDRLYSVRLANFNKVDAMMMIYFMTLKKNILASYNFDTEQIADILIYLRENRTSIKNMSIRTLLKIAEHMKNEPADWRVFCDAVLLDDETYGEGSADEA